MRTSEFGTRELEKLGGRVGKSMFSNSQVSANENVYDSLLLALKVVLDNIRRNSSIILKHA